MEYTLRFWVENMTPVEVVERALPLLKRFDAGVGMAVFRETMSDECAAALREIAGEGVDLYLWPLLPADEGYFPNERNIDAFESYLCEMLDWADSTAVRPSTVAFDMEMPFGQMLDVLRGGPAGRLKALKAFVYDNLDRRHYEESSDRFRAMVDLVHSRGMRTLAAVLPWVALELEGDWQVIQDMFETPLAGVGFDILHPMWYASMIQDMTFGILNQADANWLSYDSCLWLRCRYGAGAGVSLGVTGTGVFGDEKTFSSVGELMVGVEAALAAGIRDIGVYNLEGIINGPDPLSWFEALRSAKPRAPHRTVKAAAMLSLARLLYPSLARHLDRLR